MDDIFQIVGEMGRFQLMTCFIIGLVCWESSILVLVSVFNGAEPQLICTYKNETYTFTYPSQLSCHIWTTEFKNQNNKTNGSYNCAFDKTFYDITYVTEWELVCDKKYQANMIQTM